MDGIKGTDSRVAQGDSSRSLRPGEHGVSEIVGVVLLLAVVVMGVGLIAVTIYSQPTPGETPQVDILVSETDTAVRLTHNGGDPLAKGTFYVLADGVRLDDPISPPGGDWPWSIGGVLQYGVDGAPGQVQVVYSGGGGAVLLKSATFSGTAGAGGPDVPAVPGGGGGLHYDFDTPEERDAWVIDQFVEMLEGNSIYLSQTLQGNSGFWDSSGFFNFTVWARDSDLNLSTNGNNPVSVPFVVGQKVSIKLDNSEIRFFAIGQSGWHILASDVTIYRDNTELPYKYILGGKIDGFKDFTSSVTIKTVASKNLHTDLYVNNTQLINDAWSKEITLAGIKPADPTLMILDISHVDPCYFIGTAESITGYT
jgi:hypothetical protein